MSDGKSTYTIVLSSDVQKFLNGFTAAGEKAKQFVQTITGLLGVGLGTYELVQFAKELINSAEAMGTLAKQSTFSVSTLSAIKEQTEETTISFDDLRGSITLFTSKLQSAREKGGEAMDVFRGISQEVALAVAQARPAEQVYGMIAEKFREGALAGREQMIAQELFGKSFREWIPLLQEGADGLEKMRAQGGGITQEDVDRATEFNKTLRGLKNEFENIARRLVMDVLPALKEFVQFLKDGVLAIELGRFSEFFELSMKSAVQEVSNFFAKEIAKWSQQIDQLMNKQKGTVQGLRTDQKAAAFGLGASKGIIGLFSLIPGVVNQSAKEFGEEKIFEANEIFKKLGVADGILSTLADAYVAGKSGKNLPNEYKAALDKLRAEMKAQVDAGALNRDSGAPSPTTLPEVVVGGSALTNNKIEAQIKELQFLRAKQQLQEKIIQTDPYTTEAAKVRELLPYLNAEQDILRQQIDIQNQIATDATRTDTEQARAKLEIIRLQEQQLSLQRESKNLEDSVSFVGTMKRGLTELSNAWGSTWKELGSRTAVTALGAIQTAVQGVSEGIMGMIDGTRTWGQVFAQVGRSIIASIIQMVVQWIASMTIIAALKAIFGVKDIAQAEASAVAWAPAAIAASIASFGTASAVGAAAFGAAMISGTALAAGLSAVGGAGGIAGRASGGPVDGSTPYIVGEKGPELMIPNWSGTVIPADKTAAFMRGLGGLYGRVSLPTSPLDGNSSSARSLNRGLASGAGDGMAPIVNVAPTPVKMIVVNSRQEMLDAMKSSEGEAIHVEHIQRNRVKVGIQT